jgi:hypothetical protein
LFLRSTPPEVAEAMIEASVALRVQDLGRPEDR